MLTISSLSFVVANVLLPQILQKFLIRGVDESVALSS